MRAAAMAILWECWSIERKNLLGRLILSFSMTGLLLVLASRFDPLDGRIFSELAKGILFVSVFAAIFSTKLGNDEAGFPLKLLFVRPVSTKLIAFMTSLYFGLSRLLLFIVPALAFTWLFALEMPVTLISMGILTTALASAASEWWTSNKFMCIFTALFVAFMLLPPYFYLIYKMTEGEGLLSSLTIYQEFLLFGYQALICLVAFTVIYIGVGRQRRGSDFFNNINIGIAWENIFRLQWGFLFTKRCPNSSALSAEIWREMRVNGVSTLSIGILLALALPVMHELIEFLRSVNENPRPNRGPMVALIVIFCFIIPLFVATKNLLDIRQVRGAVSLSLFDAVRPITVSKLMLIKITVLLSTLLSSCVIVYCSYWLTIVFLGNDQTGTIHSALLSYISNNSIITIAIQGFVYLVQLVTLALFFAAIQVFWVLNTKVLAIVFFGGLGLIFLGIYGVAWSEDIGFPLIVFTMWLLVAGLLGITVSVIKNLLHNHILKLSHITFMLAGWILFVVAYFYLENIGGSEGAGWGMALTLWKTLVALTPLLVFSYTLRSIARIRYRS